MRWAIAAWTRAGRGVGPVELIDRLVAGHTQYPPNRRLLNHLARERSALFTFLTTEGVQATNWRAEHAIRPAVLTRKKWGGNRTRSGAVTWQVLASVLTSLPIPVVVPAGQNL